jgi:predicted RNA-binding Zn ribbon-like protein
MTEPPSMEPPAHDPDAKQSGSKQSLSKEAGSLKRFDLSGGHVALDFVNTLSNRLGEPRERLPNYAALLFWAEQAGVLPRYHIEGMFRQSLRVPGQALTVLQEAIALREALFEIFTAAAQRRVVPGKALTKLNFYLIQGASYVRLAHKGRRFEWDWVSSNGSLNAMLWPVARAAADLLMSGDLERVRECASEDCAWLFLDHTRNGRRRWCDMKTCGNRVKARRHYERARASSS